jgi:hypothetical protein
MIRAAPLGGRSKSPPGSHFLIGEILKIFSHRKIENFSALIKNRLQRSASAPSSPTLYKGSLTKLED